MARSKQQPTESRGVSTANWRTSDEDELAKRRQRARDESFQISNQEARHPIFSNFQVRSGSGQTYSVEIRDVAGRQFACDCVDFRTNGLGTCKHVEAVLLQLETRFRRLFRAAMAQGSNRRDLVVDGAANALRLTGSPAALPRPARAWFEAPVRVEGAKRSLAGPGNSGAVVSLPA